MQVVEKKIPSVSDLVTKTDYVTKISGIEAKYFNTSSDYGNVTNKILGAKIKEQMLADKTDISGFIDYSDLNKQHYQPKEN